jgi:uncharacterized protein involved in exopolysaccharide biosynthesis
VKAGLDHHTWPAAPARIPDGGDERQRAASEDEVDLGWLWTTLVRRWRLLLAAIVVGTGITAALVLLSPPLYEAAATLVVPGSAASPSSNANAVRNVLTGSAVLSNVNTALESEQFRASLDTGSILVDPVGGTTLVRLRVRATDAAAASRAVPLLAERGAAAAREMREKALKTARPALDTDVEDAAKRLEGSEQRLLEFRRQARIEVLESKVARQLEARRTAATIDRDLLNELYQRQFELRRLEREVRIAEQVYAAQLVRGRQADTVQAVPLIELADATIGPAAPVGRDVPRKVALAFVLSLLLGSGLVVFLEAARS